MVVVKKKNNISLLVGNGKRTAVFHVKVSLFFWPIHPSTPTNHPYEVKASGTLIRNKCLMTLNDHMSCLIYHKHYFMKTDIVFLKSDTRQPICN